MYPTINNKSLLECEMEDFEVLLHNPDYREGQYLEYKRVIHYMNIRDDKVQREKEKAEFRSDVCAFANADGGFIIIGVDEENGEAQDLVGVEISDLDKYELDIRNVLGTIQPKTPPVQIHFVSVTPGKYIVVIFVEHDSFFPYLHVVDEREYRAFKRNGNGKIRIQYLELKQMFISSQEFSERIKRFIADRIKWYAQYGYATTSAFVLLDIVPESYLTESKSLFLLERQKKMCLGNVFDGTGAEKSSIPFVDGLRYVDINGNHIGYLNNNGVAEYFLGLEEYFFYNGEKGKHLCVADIWKYIERVIRGYRSTVPAIFGSQRYYSYVTVYGCKGVVSEADIGLYVSRIDRDEIISNPTVFYNIESEEEFVHCLNQMKLDYYLSLGIKRTCGINDLLKALLQNEQ